MIKNNKLIIKIRKRNAMQTTLKNKIKKIKEIKNN